MNNARSGDYVTRFGAVPLYVHPHAIIRHVDLLPRLTAFLEAHPQLQSATPYVVGVSGGADSLALLHVLTTYFRFGPSAPFPLVVAHLDHGLRPDSAEDAAFVGQIAAGWGLAVVTERQDVRALAKARRLSLEEAGRQARYAFLARVSERHDAGAVFVGHNADDQSETVLMHLLRGAGLAGLRGMLPVGLLSGLRLPDVTPRPGLWLARPLLTTTREQIEAYCAENGLQPRYDPSNEDLTLFRNRLRHEALPLLESLNPRAREILRRTADVAAADHEVLQHARDQAWESALVRAADASQETGQIAFDRRAFCSLLPGLRRGLLRRAVYELRPNLRDVDFAPVAHAADFALSASSGQRAPLPGGLCLTVAYEGLIVAPSDAELWPRAALPFLSGGEPVPLPVPGQLLLEPSGWRVVLAQLDASPLGEVAANRDPWRADMDAARLREPLRLRTRQAGDRFHPLGLGGHSQTVADFMINAKIPAAWRDRLPVLVGGEQIVWLPGWRLDHRVRVTGTTTRITRVKFVSPGE